MKVLALDQGTTSTRALVFDEHARTTPLASLPHRQIYPQNGWVEHDPEELIANLKSCIDAAGDLPDLGAIGLDNQGESCLGWNADTGEAVGPVIVWQDGRTQPDIDRLRADGTEPVVQALAGLPLGSYFSGAKLGWLLREIPEAKRLAAKGKLRLGTTDAFFLDRLTGRFVTDVTTASRTSLMNLSSCTWDDELCRLFGVPIEALPEIVDTTGDFGAVACGDRHVPLTASIVDQQAALYGHGCRNTGDTKITFGTGAFALTVTEALRRDAGGPLPTIAWRKRGESPAYALDGGVYCASSALNWARQLGLFNEFAEIDAFDNPPAIDRCLAFVPALSGLACPHWDSSARGAWLGLSLDTSPLDMVQALLEGVALRMAEVVRSIEAVEQVSKTLSIDGGMSANTYFCQFLADTLQRDIIVSDNLELTATGTAALAAEGAGFTLPVLRSGRKVVPQVAQQTAINRNERFERAVAAVQSFGS